MAAAAAVAVAAATVTASAAGPLLARAGRGCQGRGARIAAQAGPGWARHLLGVPGRDHRAAGRAQHADPPSGAIARHHVRGAQRRDDGLHVHGPLRGGRAGPTSTTLEAGPCGSIGYEIVGPHQRNVWPGDRVVNCPALGFAQLAPGATVTGTGSWNQTRPDGAQRVPVGNYTLVVNRRFSFPIHVVAH